jgi:hypothetical protein
MCFTHAAFWENTRLARHFLRISLFIRFFQRKYFKRNYSTLEPLLNCGQPFIANPQSAFFYPLNWIYYLLEFHQAYTLFIFIHLLLAGVFMYAFIKPIVKNSWISFFGGVI